MGRNESHDGSVCYIVEFTLLEAGYREDTLFIEGYVCLFWEMIHYKGALPVFTFGIPECGFAVYRPKREVDDAFEYSG